MSLAKTFGGAVQGVEACIITIEANVGQGTKFFIVGLPDNAVKESEHRVVTAIKQLGYSMPRQKVVITWLLPI